MTKWSSQVGLFLFIYNFATTLKVKLIKNKYEENRI